MTYVDPAELTPQADTLDDADERVALKLTLVIDGNAGRREYPTDADAAWRYYNDAYDHANGSCETTDDSDGCYYVRRSA